MNAIVERRRVGEEKATTPRKRKREGPVLERGRDFSPPTYRARRINSKQRADDRKHVAENDRARQLFLREPRSICWNDGGAEENPTLGVPKHCPTACGHGVRITYKQSHQFVPGSRNENVVDVGETDVVRPYCCQASVCSSSRTDALVKTYYRHPFRHRGKRYPGGVVDDNDLESARD